MSNQSPDEIRADIEATRRRLDADVDAVAEKVTPENVVDRQKTKARNKVQNVKESIMGSADDARSTGSDVRASVAERADQAREAVSDAPSAARARTRGNPMAAGLIALGAGWLLGSLLPATQKEQEAAESAAARLQPHAQKATSSVKSTAGDIAEDLKEPAQKAAQSVKDTARSGAQDVKSQSQQEAERLKGSAQDSADSVKSTAQDR